MKICLLKSTWLNGQSHLMGESAVVEPKWGNYLIEQGKAVLVSEKTSNTVSSKKTKKAINNVA